MGATSKFSQSYRGTSMKQRILIVEDDPAIADFLLKGLREEGYTAVRVADGELGLFRLGSEPWDAVLLDCWLPKLDGIELLRLFRKRGGETPVILLTARDAIADRVLGLDSGADDYLCKPFAFSELLARIRSLVRRRRAPADTTLAYSNVRVDLTSRRATRDGIYLDLTTKENCLLVCFLQNPECVLTREQIYESVWNQPYDRSSNTLEMHVMELRRKLEAHGPRLIFTLRGRGYVLSEKCRSELEQV
jgi:two-component system copper resistance phosphate regulon response regulator CusR